MVVCVCMSSVFFTSYESVLVAVILLTAGGHSGGDAGPKKWGQGLGAETQRHYHPTCHRW